MATIISRDPIETFALGERFGTSAGAGLVLGLRGDLGAGKTEFVKGLAKGVGYMGRVHSPTFALLNEYLGGRLPVYHIDLYRLETAREIASASLDDYFYQRDGVTVIEWIDRLLDAEGRLIIPGAKVIAFEQTELSERKITYDDFSP